MALLISKPKTSRYLDELSETAITDRHVTNTNAMSRI